MEEYKKGLDHYKRKAYKEAFDIFLPLAEQGNTKAMGYVSLMYDKGLGVCQDYKKSFQWTLEDVNKNGPSKVNIVLGLQYHYGQGVSRNRVLAVEHYQKGLPYASDKNLVIQQIKELMTDEMLATLILTDQARQSEIKKLQGEVSSLKDEIDRFKDTINELRTEIDYRPGGKGYVSAEEHFRDLSHL